VSQDQGENAVAIIGLSARLPGAPDVEAFWALLRDGREAVRMLSTDELRAAGVPDRVRSSPRFVAAASTLEEVELFDAAFFGIGAREAEVMDPQLRIFLETAWAAMEDAGHDPRRLGGPVGVFAGGSASEYLQQHLQPRRDLLASVGGLQVHLVNAPDSLASLVSYKLDLTGPSVSVQTACSTSLVAVHLACQSLLSGECDLALAGGVSVRVGTPSGYLHQEGGILSRDGHTRTFDAEASGTVMGSGVGAVVLRRLADALQDGDRVRAVVRGSAVNNDGSAKGGYTSPSVTGHARVVTEALAVAGVRPESIGYVEAHGTGTVLGDPIEVEGLSRAFREGTARKGFCALGSVKTNLGHLDHAAGVASLIKAVLCLEHGQIPASLHFETPNPKIDFEQSPFYVSRRLSDWPCNGVPRRAGVSSLGIGGTNAHVVLEEAPARSLDRAAVRPRALVLSARSPAALDRATRRLADRLRSGPGLDLVDVAFTLAVGRRRFAHGRTVVAADAEEAAQALERLDPERVWSGVLPPVPAGCVFLFPGQGTQYPGMARGLYQRFQGFRRDIDACCDSLRPHLGVELRDLLFPAVGSEVARAARELEETRLAQPALFAVEYALARLWMSWGVEPEAMVGHSIGEWVAACLADVVGLDDALGLVARRGQLMQDCPRGAMLAAALGARELAQTLPPRVALAASNGPASSVAAGPESSIAALEDELRRRGVPARRLRTSHAFHSPAMEGAVEPFAEAVARVRLGAPRLRFVSNPSGDWITDDQARDPRYWARQLREPVLFMDGVGRALREAPQVLLEVGPGQGLGGLVRGHPAWGESHAVLASLPPPEKGGSDERVLMAALGRLWLAGVPVDLTSGDREGRPRRVPLPTYPFERQRYWIERAPLAAASTPAATTPTNSADADGGLYVPAWRAAPSVTITRPASERWLVLGNGSGLSAGVVERLRRGGHEVVEARRGPSHGDERVTAVDPGSAEGYARLAEELAQRSATPLRVLDLWTLGDAEGGADDDASGALDRLAGFHDLREAFFTLRGLGLSPSRLQVVTAGAVDLGAGRVRPADAMLRPLCLVMRQENPGLEAGLVDLPAPQGMEAEEAKDRLLEQLQDELSRPECEPLVALRDGLRFRPDFEPLPDAAAMDVERGLLRAEGVYLITGGLGRVGSAVAAHLARCVRARLVLTARTALPDRQEWTRWLDPVRAETPTGRRVRLVSALEALGSEVLVLAADVADETAMRSVVARTRERFGSLDGVVHAAGVLDPAAWRPLRELSRSECVRQLRPKVDGVDVLSRVLEGEACDFVLLMSSLSAVLGGVGYGAYAAGNAYLDAFVAVQHRRGRSQWTSVGWDSWTSEGDALRALDRILGMRRTRQVLVSTTDLQQRLCQASRLLPLAAAEEAAAGGRHARPDLHSVYVAAESRLERRLCAIWCETLGLERVGLDDNFFELGGSSLLAIGMLEKVAAAFEVEMPAASVFEGPTVRSMGRLVEERSGRQGAVASAASAEGSRG